MRATLPANSRFSPAGGLSDTYPGPSRSRRSIPARPGISSAPAPAATGASASAASGAGYPGTGPGSGCASAAATTAGPIGQALLSRVNSVSTKVESILGSGKRPGRSPLPVSRPSSLGDKLVDLTEKLARLESLLDEAQSRAIFNPPPRRPELDAVAKLEVAADASVDAVARSLIASMNQHHGCCNGHSHTPPHHTAVVPPAPEPPSSFLQQAVAAAAAAAAAADSSPSYLESRAPPVSVLRNQVVRQQSYSRAATPLPSSRVQTVQTPGRFVEISPGLSAGVPSAVPVNPCLRSPAGHPSGNGSGGLRSPAGHPSGNGSGGLTPPAGLPAPAGLRTPNLAPPPATPAMPGAPPMLAIRGMAESLALGANRQLNGAKTPLNGGSTPRLSFGPGYSPGPFLASRAAAAAEAAGIVGGACATPTIPLDGRMSPPMPFAGVATPTSRNASVSRHPSGQGDGAFRGSIPPLIGFHSPSFDLEKQQEKKTEMKIRQWLSTIPIGNGEERGWDDAQIREIANFAEMRGIENVSAEEMYKRYVEHQVSQAEAEERYMS